MATKYYAWTNFVTENNEWGQPLEVLEAGDPITQKDISVSDEEWTDLIQNGSVREEKYPDIPNHVSPAEYYNKFGPPRLDDDDVESGQISEEEQAKLLAEAEKAAADEAAAKAAKSASAPAKPVTGK